MSPTTKTSTKPVPSTVQLILVHFCIWTGIACLDSSLNLHGLAWLPFVLQWLVALPSIQLWNSEHYYDLSGGLTYWALTLTSLFLRVQSQTTHLLSSRQVMSTFCILCWSAKLSYFLFRRIQRDRGVDRRFDVVKSNPLLFFLFWNVQALWVLLTLVPYMLLNQTTRLDVDTLGVVDHVWMFLWTFGFLLETIADHQKTRFRAQELPHDHPWITSGLWHYSQHPNYFGEICCWLGLYGLCMTSPGMTSIPLQVLGLVSPVTVAVLLLFVSGIPMLDEQAEAKGWTKEPAYQRYCAQTNVLIPWWPRTS